MNQRAWTLREGFAIGAVPTAAGLLVQWAAGPVVWQQMAWPANIIVLAGFIALIAATALCSRRYEGLRFLATAAAAVPALCYGVGLTMAMGLIRQTGSGHWTTDMLTAWPFVLTYTYIAFILGLTTLKRARRLLHPTLADIAFVLNHAGLFTALVAGTLGNPDIQRLKMIATYDSPERRAMSSDRRIVELPITIELKHFIMETYPDGQPRRFASEIEIAEPDGHTATATVDVNHPVRIGSWKLYQSGYDTEAGPDSRISILELVRDPWLPAVYTGIFMMLAGAALMFFRR